MQALITQEALAQYHTDKLKISFLLSDEIEKASGAPGLFEHKSRDSW
jgi:hypothetical protein